MAVNAHALQMRLLAGVVVVGAAACVFALDPVQASADEPPASAVTVSVEIAPRMPVVGTEGGLPATGAAVLAPAVIATGAVLGGAVLLGRRRRAQDG